MPAPHWGRLATEAIHLVLEQSRSHVHKKDDIVGRSLDIKADLSDLPSQHFAQRSDAKRATLTRNPSVALHLVEFPNDILLLVPLVGHPDGADFQDALVFPMDYHSTLVTSIQSNLHRHIDEETGLGGIVGGK